MEILTTMYARNNSRILLVATNGLLGLSPIALLGAYPLVLMFFGLVNFEKSKISYFLTLACFLVPIILPVLASLLMSVHVVRTAKIKSNNVVIFRSPEAFLMALSTLFPLIIQLISWAFFTMVVKDELIAMLSLLLYIPMWIAQIFYVWILSKRFIDKI